MIGRIRGTLLEKQAPELLVDVQGVGYEIQVSLTTYFSLPAPGEAVTLHTTSIPWCACPVLVGQLRSVWWWR